MSTKFCLRWCRSRLSCLVAINRYTFRDTLLRKPKTNWHEAALVEESNQDFKNQSSFVIKPFFSESHRPGDSLCQPTTRSVRMACWSCSRFWAVWLCILLFRQYAQTQPIYSTQIQIIFNKQKKCILDISSIDAWRHIYTQWFPLKKIHLRRLSGKWPFCSEPSVLITQVYPMASIHTILSFVGNIIVLGESVLFIILYSSKLLNCRWYQWSDYERYTYNQQVPHKNKAKRDLCT